MKDATEKWRIWKRDGERNEYNDNIHDNIESPLLGQKGDMLHVLFATRTRTRTTHHQIDTRNPVEIMEIT